MKTIEKSEDLAINGALPLFDAPLHVGRPNLGSKDAFLRLVDGIFERRWLTNNGPLVLDLESRIAERLRVKHCIAMCNGTVALEIAIRALDLTGEVIVPSYTFVATAHALHWQGISPVFADIDPKTHNLDPTAVERMITPRTSGIIGVHLWGRPSAIDRLSEIANNHQLKLLFDAAHGFACTSGGVPLGNFGSAEVLSFHATKFFNTFEGGAVVTNDDQLADRIRLMRNFGFSGYDNVIHPGTNGKMTEICAAMGIANLDVLDETMNANARTHALYLSAFNDVDGVDILPFDSGETNNFQYVVLQFSQALAGIRDRVIEALHAENVLARKYFWPGVHRMAPYNQLYPHAHFVLPNTEAVAARVVVLPGGPGIDHDMVNGIRDVVAAVIAAKSA